MAGSFRKILCVACLLFSTVAFCQSFELRFSVSLDNDANDVFPAVFAAFGSPENLPDTLDASVLFSPPGPPSGDYVTITQSNPPDEQIRQTLAYDPNEPDLLYVMNLIAFDSQSTGLSGDCIIKLENPEALEQLPPDCLVYIRRFDQAGVFAASYDISDPANHSFQWPVADVSGLFGRLDFLLVDRCMAADLIINDTIDLDDFSALSANWNKTGNSLTGDIFLDETVNLKDLSVLAEKWLCSCEE